MPVDAIAAPPPPAVPCQHWRETCTATTAFTWSVIDVLPYGRQEEWQDSPQGWPQSPTYSRWASSQEIAREYGTDPDAALQPASQPISGD